MSAVGEIVPKPLDIAVGRAACRRFFDEEMAWDSIKGGRVVKKCTCNPCLNLFSSRMDQKNNNVYGTMSGLICKLQDVGKTGELELETRSPNFSGKEEQEVGPMTCDQN
ncbi:unnamed protein product [Dibothriocephalus latus]|uniref:Uncharacterized protein n=1 Tax=Dibothriocephalus latus TaxID=60516 RepID=A0A3P6TIE2_DIBLA|nr:unnamed protein product [Dibothriocephalus latus]